MVVFTMVSWTPDAFAHIASSAITMVPVINTYAGNGTAGYKGDGGPAIDGEINSPQDYSVAVDDAGNLYFADSSNNVVRMVAAGTGVITTVAGNGTNGYAGDGGPATNAELSNPTGVAVDNAGNLYIADQGNWRVREVVLSPIGATGTAGVEGVSTTVGNIYTVAGGGIPNGNKSGDGGPATGQNAALDYPSAVAIDSQGNLYIADSSDNSVRMVAALTGASTGIAGAEGTSTTAGYIYTVAGGGGCGSSSCGDGGPATKADLGNPLGVAVDWAGNLYIADTKNAVIRMVAASTGASGIAGAEGTSTTAGDIYTVAPNKVLGYDKNGTGIEGFSIPAPVGVSVDGNGNLYIADVSSNWIYMVAAETGTWLGGMPIQAGYAYVVAGSGSTTSSGDGGPATSAGMGNPSGTTIDSIGNLYIALPASVRKVSTNTQFPTTAVGKAPGQQNVYVQFAEATSINSIQVPVAQNGQYDFTIGAITGCTLGGSTTNAAGTICTVPITFSPQYPGVRTGELTVNIGGPAYTVGLYGTGDAPQAVFTPSQEEKVSMGSLSLPSFHPTGLAVDGAGDLYVSDSGDQEVIKTVYAQSVVASGINDPNGVAVDAAGNVYYINDRVNDVNADELSPEGTSQQVASSSVYSYFTSIAVDLSGNVYIADSGLHVVYKLTPNTNYGWGETQVNVTGLSSTNGPNGVAVDASGNVYIADTGNNRIVKVAQNGSQTTVGNGLNAPIGVAVDGAGNVYITDTGNDRVVAETPDGTQVTIASESTNGLINAQSVLASIAADGAGNVYVADTGNNYVFVVARGSSSMTFATTNVGSTSADSPQTVAVQNIGNQTLDFTDLSVTTNFNLNGDTTCTTSSTLA
ncbi:MAG: NHL repeat-containing protein, partial [Acidobacteriaceae bacterium]